jgi:hypothetical protein
MVPGDNLADLRTTACSKPASFLLCIVMGHYFKGLHETFPLRGLLFRNVLHLSMILGYVVAMSTAATLIHLFSTLVSQRARSQLLRHIP